MTVKEAVKYLIYLGGYTFEIVACLFTFLNSIDIIFGLKSIIEMEGMSNFAEMEIKKRPIDIHLEMKIHVPVGKPTAFDCEISKKPYLMDGLVIVKMKSTRNDCSSQTLRTGMVNMNVSNTGNVICR